MKQLLPYAPGADQIEIRGHLTRVEHQLTVEFSLHDPRRQVLDALHPGVWKNWERGDDLWKTTCFEIFFAVRDQSAYWEFNFSPAKLKWNLYFFDSYRSPQPPRRSNDFELSEIKMTADSIICKLDSDVLVDAFEANLCAVIRTKKGISYYAFQHGSDKPDFHNRKCFLKEAQDDGAQN